MSSKCIALLCYSIALQCYSIETKFYEKALMNELSRKIFKTSDGAELSHPMAAQLLIMFFNWKISASITNE
jgi:hypothetical protein